MVEKVPHVHGWRVESNCALIDGMGESGARGKEKSCIRWNLPGLSSFGIIDKGEVWKGPMAASSSALVNGPTCRCVAYSCCNMLRKVAE